MIQVHEAAERYRVEHDGITSLSCFSAGRNYDPSNINFGPLIGVDEHRLEPGVGFAAHAHRGVEIISWVLDGTLQHEDDSGRPTQVGPGTLQHLSTGAGIRHSEMNGSATHRLRFVQMTLSGGGGGTAYWIGSPPRQVGAGRFSVLDTDAHLSAPRLHLFVAHGGFAVNGRELLPGDSLRSDEELEIEGEGQLLVWELAD